ncbi:hypothetical protein PMIT1303_00683 [Prochlorococcus sp. MIT 1303]|nr:hypothetical protein PMIT1303_00683 [Prochlorococcus sp. MIT 1303]
MRNIYRLNVLGVSYVYVLDWQIFLGADHRKLSQQYWPHQSMIVVVH